MEKYGDLTSLQLPRRRCAVMQLAHELLQCSTGCSVLHTPRTETPKTAECLHPGSSVAVHAFLERESAKHLEPETAISGALYMPTYLLAYLTYVNKHRYRTFAAHSRRLGRKVAVVLCVGGYIFMISFPYVSSPFPQTNSVPTLLWSLFVVSHLTTANWHSAFTGLAADIPGGKDRSQGHGLLPV
ncbi:hypothetical protein K449DRAFT_466589 [Hypoxylon sp. EC38]|nr:hypothetical protein K449DRAFT_466589 [Hypoxylon sp. EC38]